MPEKKEYGNFKKPGASPRSSSSSSPLSKPPNKKKKLTKQSSFKDEKDDKQLSSGLMGMKFMQRMKETELREKLRQEQEKMLAESQWTRRKSLSSAGVIEEEGIGAADMVGVSGRMSFGNFNPALESLQNKKDSDKDDSKKAKKDNGLPKGVNIQGISGQGSKGASQKKKGKGGGYGGKGGEKKRKRY